MKLYDYYRSSACYRVRIVLNLKNISYESLSIHLVNNGGEQHHPEYMNLNPQGLVPTLVVNGHIISQSLAIIEYLDEINPTPALLPQTPLGRSQVRSLALLIACDIHPLNNLRTMQQLRQQFNATEQQEKEWYFHWLKTGFDALEHRLQHLARKSYFCYGNDVSLADICLVPQVYNAKRFKFSMTAYPLVEEIYNYCNTLPEFIEAEPEIVISRT